MPPAAKQRFLSLKGKTGYYTGTEGRGSDISARESKSYWVDSAKHIGLYDSEEGIKRWAAAPTVSAAALSAVQAGSSTK